MPNRLIHSRSPYLLQHAHNPVEWYEWGEEAFQVAKDEDKPIFLSIGYSSCHWCHIMEKESFHNQEIAEILNTYFIPIKVDREERPDVDATYIVAVQMLTGSAGWPLSLFLTPDLKPFYGGTYYPPEDRWGKIGFKKLLLTIVEIWQNRRSQINRAGEEIYQIINNYAQSHSHPSPIDPSQVRRAARLVSQSFDPLHGGFGPAPKFPPTGQLELLMRLFHRDGELDYGVMVSRTLHKMAQGGIYDHLGGGFARYSTDAAWQIPHFEKMLYDNALLALTYMDAFLVLRDPFFLQIAEETLMGLISDLGSPDGGFYSSRDADSEGEEGKFYLWSWDELKESLSYDEFELVNLIFDLNPQGNFNGVNILRMRASWDELATQIGWSVEKLKEYWQPIREKLRLIRSRRIPPARDEKILCDWNGLAIAALSRAYRVTGKDIYLDTARSAAQFIFHQLWCADERLREPKSAIPILYHRWWKGNAGIRGMLDDYAFTMWGLVELYFADFDPQWIKWCCDLAQSIETNLAVEASSSGQNSPGGFYNSPNNDQGVIKFYSANDSFVPSGNAIAGIVFWHLWQLTGKIHYRHRTEAIAESFSGNLADNPTAHLKLALLIDHITQPTHQIVLALPNSKPLKNLLRIINLKYLPNVVIAVRCLDTSGDHSPSDESIIELLKDKEPINHKPTLYICRDFVCDNPITEIPAIEEALSSL